MSVDERHHCYCGTDGDLIKHVDGVHTCQQCLKSFHRECLQSCYPSDLHGDVYFQFTCAWCSENREEQWNRLPLHWSQVVQLALRNLPLTSIGKHGYYHWKEHICAFIEKYWTTFFGHVRKRTSLWNGTVAGALSTGSGTLFISGSSELKQAGWWRLINQDDKGASSEQENLLACTDSDGSLSDVEIDPSSMSPPVEAGFIQSPSVSELMQFMKGDPIEEIVNVKVEPPDEQGESPLVYDSHVTPDLSEQSSDSESSRDQESDKQVEVAENMIIQRKRKRRRKAKSSTEETELKQIVENRCVQMSLYEETQLRKRLNAATEHQSLPVDLHRLRRKLNVRKVKRERGLPLFDLDKEVNRLTGAEANQRNTSQDQAFDVVNRYTTPYNIPISHLRTPDTRLLDRYQTLHYLSAYQPLHQPVFLNRLVGTEDDQLKPVCSPYTARMLKPFIRRDYETRPLKLKLLQEIRDHWCRKNKLNHSVNQRTASIDYCYIRPEHIPSVNTLCREFFWPGIDLSECLQYPDFSCVVLYRKLVVGFAFMVPDAKYNEAYISFIFTHPEWRQSGIATFMIYHLIQTCMGKDLTLHVSANNPAMLLYQKFGFKPEEICLDFYDKYYPEDSKQCKHAFFLRLCR